MRGALALAFAFALSGLLGRPVLGDEFTDQIQQGTFGMGVNYPGLGAKYFLTDDYAAEAKAQVQTGDFVAGLRGYRYFRPVTKMFLFGGVEADYVHFKATLSRGAGYAGEVFAGLEYFVYPHCAVQIDFGPAYVALKDQTSSFSASGFEYVMNFGINYYFGRSPVAGAPAAKDANQERGYDPWRY